MKQKYVVSDTNIFIDLISIDLLSAFFSLPFQFYTTDFVIAEIKDSEQQKKINKYIKNKKLIITKFDSSEMKELYTLYSVHSYKLSIADCSVWLCAKKKCARLLTGDALLRKLVDKENFYEVSGILFVFDELIDKNIIANAIACKKLESLMHINPRLPNTTCLEKINNWNKNRRKT